MELPDIPPGRVVGEARSMLPEHARQHGALDRDEAVALLRSWWAARQAVINGETPQSSDMRPAAPAE